MDRQPAAGAMLLEPSTKTLGHVRGMRSFPHFSNWLGMTITGIEWEQSEVVFNCPHRTVILVLAIGDAFTLLASLDSCALNMLPTLCPQSR